MLLRRLTLTFSTCSQPTAPERRPGVGLLLGHAVPGAPQADVDSFRQRLFVAPLVDELARKRCALTRWGDIA
eukprot:CAMPEP_0171252318 /NCGR_PEP_ID=MMETSP0790-20130122/51104_1 /TAXON_ID=2925 /ORGANISM="Alexandrium catenella, Strain OF101" /LENGTH=71 /DNA_ID=CAMNT_0011720065 /DNA_START=1 /DNA_END=212 /DNA_ORIENTATION=-